MIPHPGGNMYTHSPEKWWENGPLAKIRTCKMNSIKKGIKMEITWKLPSIYLSLHWMTYISMANGLYLSPLNIWVTTSHYVSTKSEKDWTFFNLKVFRVKYY